jgi:hypothetical protein
MDLRILVVKFKVMSSKGKIRLSMGRVRMVGGMGKGCKKTGRIRMEAQKGE